VEHKPGEVTRLFDKHYCQNFFPAHISPLIIFIHVREIHAMNLRINELVIHFLLKLVFLDPFFVIVDINFTCNKFLMSRKIHSVHEKPLVYVQVHQ